MREGGEPSLRRRDADLGQELDGAVAALLAAAAFMRRQAFHDLVADGEAGIEAGHRLLEDHGDVLADDLAPRARAEAQYVLALEGHPIGEDAAGIRDQAHD